MHDDELLERLNAAKHAHRSEGNTNPQNAPTQGNLNKSGNARCTNELRLPSSTTVYTRGVQSMEGGLSSSSEATDYGSDDSLNLLNGVKNLVVEKWRDESQPSTSRGKGLTTNKVRQCMDIQKEKED